MNPKSSSFVLFVAAVLLVDTFAHADPPRPNILLIMADDLGFSDLGCYGGEIATPNLDSLATGGLQFSQFYNTARCWPTRGALMTGFYAQQIRRDVLPSIPGGGQGTRPDWAVLLPKLLKPAGYRSYHTGKWHIDGMPIAEGFDHSYYLGDQGRFFNPTRHWKDDVKLPPVEKGTDYYATTALADHAIEVLGEHEQQHADAPFFHYLAFTAPHFPLHALPEDIAVYEDTYTAGWDVIRAKRWRRMQQMGLLDRAAVSQPSRVERDLGPPYHFPDALETLGEGEVNKPIPWESLSDQQKKSQAAKMAIHAAMIHRVDIEIGRVFDQIKEMGQWENTLVLFLSDNGASAEIMVRDDGHDSMASPGSAETYLCLGPGWSTTCNTPFRRHKTWTHEGGTSTPLLAAWPKGIKARGEIRRSPGHVVDIAATLLELTGAETPADAPPAPGKSLVPAFSKTTAFSEDAAAKPRTIWWFHDGNKAIRMGDWKAVAPVGEPWELYHLAVDRRETQDLAVPRADKLQELVAEWKRHVDEFTEIATRDLPADVRQKVKDAANYEIEIKDKQAAGKPKRKQVLLGGKSFLLNGRHPHTAYRFDRGQWRAVYRRLCCWPELQPFTGWTTDRTNTDSLRQPVSSFDIYATAAANSEGVTTPKQVEGVDLVPFLTGKNDGVPHETFFWRQGGKTAMHHGDWKLVRMGNRLKTGKAKWELFDLSTDLSEEKNLAKSHPDRLSELVELWEQMNGEMVEPLF